MTYLQITKTKTASKISYITCNVIKFKTKFQYSYMLHNEEVTFEDMLQGNNWDGYKHYTVLIQTQVGLEIVLS